MKEIDMKMSMSMRNKHDNENGDDNESVTPHHTISYQYPPYIISYHIVSYHIIHVIHEIERVRARPRSHIYIYVHRDAGQVGHVSPRSLGTSC